MILLLVMVVKMKFSGWNWSGGGATEKNISPEEKFEGTCAFGFEGSKKINY